MGTLDRLLTIVVTATLTSAVWILFGSAYTSSWLDAGKVPAGDAAAENAEASSPPLARPVAMETPVARAPGPGHAGTLIVPVEGVKPQDLTDSFADGRDGGSRLHEALDIMAPQGSRVIAAAPGTVERLFVSAAGGNTVYVRSDDRMTIYYYAHLAAYAPGLEEGDRVEQGRVLGTVGTTGNAREGAPHLHFAIMRTTADADWWEPATAINPHPMLTRRVD